jgi:hypothetical protein
LGEPSRAQDFALRSGLGVALARASLRGRVEVDGAEVPAELWLSSRGLWLVAARSSTDGVALDLLEPGALTYESGRTSDRLVVRGSTFSTRPGNAKKVREAIALGRLGAGAERAFRGHVFPSRGSRLVRGLDRAALTLLARVLAPGETLAAWVPRTGATVLDSALGARLDAKSFWLVTDRQQALVVIGALGDVERLDFDPHACRISNGRLLLDGENALRREVWAQSSLVAEQLLELARLEGKERLLSAALLELEAGHVEWAERLLVAARSEVPLAALALEVIAVDRARTPEPHDLGASLELLRRDNAPKEAVAELWRGLSGSAEAGNLLLAKLRAHGALAEPWAVELHLGLHRKYEKHAPAPRLARHLLEAGRPEEALSLLGRGLAAGDSRIDRALTAPAPRRALAELVEQQELVAEALERAGEGTLHAVHTLARLAPLSSRRVGALAELAEGPLAERARAVLALLPPFGLPFESDEELPPTPSQRLDEALLDRKLPHPAGRKSLGTGTLQAALAATSGPDRETLRSWCERLAPERHPAAARAAARARQLLGLSPPELFVSRGERSLGVRAYGGRVPLLVIGGAHLDAASEYRLGERGLGFAIGAELAHVYFGHERVTPREVWRGAVGKARVGLELVVAALPLAKSVDLGARAAKLLEKFPARALERALGLFFELEGNLKGSLPASNELSARHEELVMAHRAQQFTADRFGLVVAGSIAEAVSGLFRVRADHHALARSIAESGLEVAAEGRLLDHPELLLRIEALVSFYLSPDFDAFSA